MLKICPKYQKIKFWRGQFILFCPRNFAANVENLLKTY
nr:MAG TPA: hypothetical protein [Caudoviricetes sp.]